MSRLAVGGSKGRGAGVRVSGLALAAMVIGALGLGFLLGRGTSNAQAAGGLKAPSGAETGMQRPRLLPNVENPTKSAPDLNLQNEAETLSKYFHVVLPYRYNERERASRLAHYLRQNGLDSARIKLFPSKTEGDFMWVTLVYVPEVAQGPEFLQRLQAVPPPDFDPRFAQRVSGPIDLQMQTAEKEGG